MKKKRTYFLVTEKNNLMIQTLESTSAFAKRVGVNPGTVYGWKQRGKLDIENGQVRVESSLKAIEKLPAFKKKKEEQRPDTPPNLYEAKSLHEQYKAGKAKLELEQTIGKLVLASEVDAEAFKVARTVRDTFQALPERLASVLAEEGDEFTVHQILTQEINQCLQALQK